MVMEGTWNELFQFLCFFFEMKKARDSEQILDYMDNCREQK